MNHLARHSLKAIDRLEITTLVDNYIDLLLDDTGIVKRPPRSSGKELPTKTLIAEHGLSLQITTYLGDEKHAILFDTGYNADSLFHNADQLDIDFQGIEAVVISHAHMDHTGAINPLLKRISKPVLLVVHPDAFIQSRSLKDKNGKHVFFPEMLHKNKISSTQATLMESDGTILMANDTLAVTGTVERTTDFEKGMPNAYIQKDGHFEKDPIFDDQSLIVRLKNKGIVLITGCCHAGIINTIRFAQKVTGISQVYGVLGGFHLGGASFESIIDRTVDELKKINPSVMVPMHCTGWNAIKKISDAFPDAFVINSVGSTFTLA